jgi:predicted TIM-barrel fold metal-dependent hydrolase
MSSPPVIDAHCHAEIGSRPGRHSPPGSLATYLRRAREAGIAHTVLFSPVGSDYGRTNTVVARLVRRAPRRFLGFLFVHPVADRGRIAGLVARAVDDWGFRGLKVHWHDGRITDEVADVARARRLPVLYDPYGDVATVRSFARAYPDVPWIVPHLSSFADDWRAQAALVDLLVRLPNVFTDTSGVRYFDVLADAITRAGPGKVLFGSDGPYLHPGAELAKVHLLHLEPSAERLVLGGNLCRLVRGVRRGPSPFPRRSP